MKQNNYNKNLNSFPQVDFNFTHYEVFNKQLDQKCNFLKNEIDLLTKMFVDREKEFEREMLTNI